MTTPRVWLITGASSGFGKTLTEYVLSKGDIVVATLRKPEVLQQLSETYPKDQLLVIEVDVTSRTDIEHAFARTKEVFGRLDVVFNNAGYVVVGDAETTPEETARALFDVNFWGAVHVSQEAVKFFRDVNKPGQGGLLLQNSSSLGLEGFVGFAFYCASKHALNGFSETLAKEMLPEWNIKICILLPGSFNTSASSNALVLPENPVYSGETSQLAARLTSMREFKPLGDPNKFARAIYGLAESGKMPIYVPLGQDALKMTSEQLESLRKDVAEASPWSADLMRDETT